MVSDRVGRVDGVTGGADRWATSRVSRPDVEYPTPEPTQSLVPRDLRYGPRRRFRVLCPVRDWETVPMSDTNAHKYMGPYTHTPYTHVRTHTYVHTYLHIRITITHKYTYTLTYKYTYIYTHSHVYRRT